MDPFTPAVLRDFYLNLSKEDRDTFLKLIAAHCTGREPLMMLEQLPREELWKYNCILHGSLIQMMLPLLIKHARQLVKQNPPPSDEEFDRELEAQVTKFVVTEQDAVSKLVLERAKKERDRKSSPTTIRRNVEICNRRKQDKKRWTLGRLAKEYKITRQTVVRILNEEVKWRQRADQL